MPPSRRSIFKHGKGRHYLHTRNKETETSQRGKYDNKFINQPINQTINKKKDEGKEEPIIDKGSFSVKTCCSQQDVAITAS